MKPFIITFFCLFTITSYSQDSVSISASWNKLSNALLHRINVFEKVAATTNKYDKVDSSILTDIFQRKSELSKILSSKKEPDSAFIQLVKIESNKMNAAFNPLLNILLNAKGRIPEKEMKDLQIDLMSAENRIAATKKAYNALVVQFGRPGLAYFTK